MLLYAPRMAVKRGARGLGSVYQLNDGRWQASKSYRDDAGIRRRVTGTGGTRTEALKRLEERWAKRQGGEVPSKQAEREKKTLYRDWFETWLDELPRTQVSEKVKWNYERNGRNYLLPYLGDTYVEDIDGEQVKKLVTRTIPELTKPDGKPLLSSATQVNIYRVLQMSLTSAVRTKRIDISRSPLDELKTSDKPKKKTQKRSLTRQANQAKGLIKYLARENHEWEARFRLAFLGLRQSERLGLRLQDVKYLNDKRRAKLNVEQALDYQSKRGLYTFKSPKTENSVRSIPLTSDVVDILRAWLKVRENYKKNPEWIEPADPRIAELLFINPDGSLITQKQDNSDWHTLLKKYLGKRYETDWWNGHLNRHLTVTLLQEQGVPISIVQGIVGHGSETMVAYYTSPTSDAMREGLSKMDKAFGGNSGT